MDAERLRGERHFADHLRCPGVRRQRDRLLKKGIARGARGRRRDGELKAW
jgi:hypothetical protein